MSKLVRILDWLAWLTVLAVAVTMSVVAVVVTAATLYETAGPIVAGAAVLFAVSAVWVVWRESR